jgi:PD-(D/E)XK nuclease superfamily
MDGCSARALIEAKGKPVTDEIRKALENFVLDTGHLEQLEQNFSRLNFFEAIGQETRELRHSDFLAYLLDPSETHGFHDEFLRLFLKRALRNLSREATPISPIELDVWDLEKTVVQRERSNIDILLTHRDRKFVVVIENKIESGEREGQLRSYRDFVEQNYSSYKKVYLYLTVEGDTPSDESYIIVTYKVVLEALEYLVQLKRPSIGGDIFILIDHYDRMIRRHLMVDESLKNLAVEIYRKHRQALEFIFEHRPDRQNELRLELERLVDTEEALERDRCSKAYIRFTVKEWDSLNGMKDGKGWTDTGRILLFEFKNLGDRLSLNLIIGPGAPEIRQKLFRLAQNTRQLFKPASRNLTTTWTTIWTKQIISSLPEYEDQDLESLKGKIAEEWTNFVSVDLPKLVPAINAAWKVADLAAEELSVTEGHQKN